MFPPNTYLKVLKALGWSIALSEEVKVALVAAELVPEVELEVTETLDRLSTVSEALQAEKGSANAGLIKADVLEWASPEARSRGMEVLKTELTQQLANLLGLDWSNSLILPGGTTTIGIDVNG
jgi:hypothetical protein